MQAAIPTIELGAIVQNRSNSPETSDVIVAVEKCGIHLPPPPRFLKARIEEESGQLYLIVFVPMKTFCKIGPMSKSEVDMLSTSGDVALGQISQGVLLEARMLKFS